MEKTELSLWHGHWRGALLIGWVAVAMLTGCVNKSGLPAKRTFPVVTVPLMYTSQQAQAEFLTMHYWDQFDFTDTAWVGSAETVTEQALVNYLSIMPYASYGVVCKGIQNLLDKADMNIAMYAFFYSKMEYYLSNPNSTLRNEELYIPVLEHMVNSNSLDAYRKVRPNTILPLLQKNRPGTRATNIHYTRPSGVKDSLSNMKSDYVLVVFYDFDCEDCNVLKQLINESEIVTEMLKQKKLAILAIYPGANMEGWKKSSPQIPTAWINGYDHDEEIGRLGTYILQSIPTLYLLDKNLTVIMKDPPFTYVESYLNGVLNPQG